MKQVIFTKESFNTVLGDFRNVVLLKLIKLKKKCTIIEEYSNKWVKLYVIFPYNWYLHFNDPGYLTQ